KSMQAALDETSRRRERQVIWNKEHGITPESVRKKINDIMESVYERGDHVQLAQAAGFADHAQVPFQSPQEIRKQIKQCEDKMRKAAANLEFEEAAKYRDEIKKLEAAELGLTGS